jgi:hypothetical protein
VIREINLAPPVAKKTGLPLETKILGISAIAALMSSCHKGDEECTCLRLQGDMEWNCPFYEYTQSTKKGSSNMFKKTVTFILSAIVGMVVVVSVVISFVVGLAYIIDNGF